MQHRSATVVHLTLPRIPTHFRTVRQLLVSLAHHRAALAALHRQLATLPGTRPDVAQLFALMAEADECLAEGLERVAYEDDVVLDTFVQYGVRAEVPDFPDRRDPMAVLRWACEVDEELRGLWRPLSGSAGAARLLELVDHLDELFTKRQQARHRWVTVGQNR